MRILALVPYPSNTTPSQRFRLEQWLPVLASQGISVDLRPFAGPRLMSVLHRPGRQLTKAALVIHAALVRASALARLAPYDAVIVHRTAALAGPAWLEKFVAARCQLVYDFDDAIFLTHTTPANRRFGWLKFAHKTGAICRMSSHVVVGNEYLADFARRYNANVTVIPSSVNTDEYVPGRRTLRQRPVVGWMGSSTSQRHLELFVPVLRDLVNRTDVEVRVVSDRRPQLGDLPFTWQPWNAEHEVEDLQGFDLGIMPMPDDAWSRGKCAMKALLYMSVGVPTVCSAVGMNAEVIHHGDNGFLASSHTEWIEALTRLATDGALRERLGDAGRATVEGRFSLRHSAKLLVDVIHQAIESRADRA